MTLEVCEEEALATVKTGAAVKRPYACRNGSQKARVRAQSPLSDYFASRVGVSWLEMAYKFPDEVIVNYVERFLERYDVYHSADCSCAFCYEGPVFDSNIEFEHDYSRGRPRWLKGVKQMVIDQSVRDRDGYSLCGICCESLRNPWRGTHLDHEIKWRPVHKVALAHPRFLEKPEDEKRRFLTEIFNDAGNLRLTHARCNLNRSRYDALATTQQKRPHSLIVTSTQSPAPGFTRGW